MEKSSYQIQTIVLTLCSKILTFFNKHWWLLFKDKKKFPDDTSLRCQMTEIQNCTLWFDRKTVSVEFFQLAVLDWDFISIWKPNPCTDSRLLKKNSIISVFILVFAGQVLSTVNGRNCSQSWQVLICIFRKSLNH